MRCFVALDLAPAVREAVVRAQRALADAAGRADVRWTAPAGFHLTLKFLGTVDEGRRAALREALESAARGRGPLALVARGLGAFPSARRPRVVWAGVAADAGLAPLAGAVDEALAPLGFPPEGRPFHAHVTLGRVRSPRGLAALGRALESAGTPELGAWTADAVVLYRSHLRAGGAVYEALERVPLAAPV